MATFRRRGTGFPSSNFPVASADWPESLKTRWNEMVRKLEAQLVLKHQGEFGENYEVSNASAIPVSVTIDLASVNLTATTQGLAKLLQDLYNSGVLRVRKKD